MSRQMLGFTNIGIWAPLADLSAPPKRTREFPLEASAGAVAVFGRVRGQADRVFDA